MPTANRNTEASCCYFAGNYLIVTCDRLLVQFCWMAIFYFNPLFKFSSLKQLKHAVAKLNGCWSSVSSEDYLNHKPLSLSERFFHHSVLNFFTSCADSQASFSTFTYGLFFFLSFVTHILVLNTDISTDLNVQLESGNVYMIEIQGPGSFAARNPLEVIYNWLFTL